MANYVKPQSPLQHKDGDYFYPLTTIDQIIMPDDSRLNANLLDVNLNGAVGSENAAVAPLSIENGGTGASDAATARANLGIKAAPRNLLDNSDFTNPVNQRGQESYTDIDYTIDRWRTYSDGETVTIQNGYISKTGNLLQYVSGLDPNKVYTAAVCLNDGTIGVYSGILSSGIGGWASLIYGAYTESTGLLSFRLTSNAVDVKWAALYEGEYTAETLPEYQYKGYGAELAECQRYFIRYSASEEVIFLICGVSSNRIYGTLHLPINMRIVPSLTYHNVNVYPYTSGDAIEIDGFTITGKTNECNALYLRCTLASAPTKEVAAIRILSGGYIELSADF